MKRFITFACLLTLVLIPFGYSNCVRPDEQKGTSTLGNPVVVNGRILPYDSPRFHLGCFTRYYYYDLQGALHEERLPEPRVIKFDPQGTDLGELSLPDYTITKFDLVFEPGCRSSELDSTTSLVINKDGPDLIFSAYHSFKFGGYYNKSVMNMADIVFNFQNYIELFDLVNSQQEFFNKFNFITGTFGPQTQVNLAPVTSSDVHLGCLMGMDVLNEIGGNPISFLPRVVNLSSGGRIFETGMLQGKYHGIFLIFGPYCSGLGLPPGVSYQVTNASGTFEATQEMSFALTGTFLIPEQREKGLLIDLQTLHRRFEGVQNQSEFNQALPSVNDVVGSFAPGD